MKISCWPRCMCRLLAVIVFLLLPVLLHGQNARAEANVKYPTHFRTVQIDGLSIFYREAGPKDAPTLLLLHGLPSSSRMFELRWGLFVEKQPYRVEFMGHDGHGTRVMRATVTNVPADQIRDANQWEVRCRLDVVCEVPIGSTAQKPHLAQKSRADEGEMARLSQR